MEMARNPIFLHAKERGVVWQKKFLKMRENRQNLWHPNQHVAYEHRIKAPRASTCSHNQNVLVRFGALDLNTATHENPSSFHVIWIQVKKFCTAFQHAPSVVKIDAKDLIAASPREEGQSSGQ